MSEICIEIPVTEATAAELVGKSIVLIPMGALELEKWTVVNQVLEPHAKGEPVPDAVKDETLQLLHGLLRASIELPSGNTLGPVQ